MERVSFRPCGAETRAVELATTTSRRKPWRFYGAQAVTSARSAGGFRGHGLTLFRNAQTTIDAVSREADEYPRRCGTFADAITDLGGI